MLKHPLKMPNALLVLPAFAAVVLFAHCGNLDEHNVPYRPPVVFKGLINNQQVDLSGNSLWKNSCKLVGDTVRMFFYSSTFVSEASIRSGDFIRLDIYPGVNDSVISVEKVLFHLARYGETISSYYLVPADTADGLNRLQIFVRRFNRVRGGEIEFERITITTNRLPGTAGDPLKISEATISGHIEEER